LFTLSRRMASTLVKSEVPADIGRVVAKGRHFVELQEY